MPLSGSAPAALSTTEFSDLMCAAGPFPGGTAVAVAVSGGTDSMALLALARDWAADTGVALTALTVDHGLRSGSDGEARQVAAWCEAQVIAHRTLIWAGEKPARGIQAAARAARYRLLEDWCRAQGHAGLLVAHTLNDQAETFLMRMSRGSGIDGLAGMPLASDRDGVRLIRPLLGVSRARIEATVAARSLETISDPSNLDRRYARVRMRDRLALLEAHGVSAEAIAGTARIFGTMRAAREQKVHRLADRISVFHRTGYAEIEQGGLVAADAETARGLVAAALASVGGREYPPRRERLDRLMADMMRDDGFRPRTLGNCVISIRRDHFLIRREHRTIRHSVFVHGARRSVWDGRFRVEFAEIAATDPDKYRLCALGEDGWRQIVSLADRANLTAWRDIPGPVRYGLPAIRNREKVVEVPHLSYRLPQLTENIIKNCEFRLRPILAAQPFLVA